MKPIIMFFVVLHLKILIFERTYFLASIDILHFQ